jgi:hypothetical protein
MHFLATSTIATEPSRATCDSRGSFAAMRRNFDSDFFV